MSQFDYIPRLSLGSDLDSDERPRAVDLMVECLRDRGIRHVFLVPGAHIDPLVTALATQNDITTTVCAHETSAGYMADGYARASGNVGVVAAIGGPGAANLLPSANIARIEHSSVLYLTGSVPQQAQSSGAFQDGSAEGTRDSELMAVATGLSRRVTSPATLTQTVQEVLDEMTDGAHRPAHLLLPYDVQCARVESHQPQSVSGPRLKLVECPSEFELRDNFVFDALKHDLIRSGPRIAILAGFGNNRSRKFPSLLRDFAEKYQIPVATTQEAKGLLPESHPLSLGSFGFAGTHRSYRVLFESSIDTLLWMGCGFDERNTLCWDQRLLNTSRKIVEVGVAASPGSRPAHAVTRKISIEEALEGLLNDKGCDLQELAAKIPERVAWLNSARDLERSTAVPDGWDVESPIHPGQMVEILRNELPSRTRLCVDSGVHRQFAARYWQSNSIDEFLTSASVASMGWAVAAGIGAKLANPTETVAVVTGDGCMQMHAMEIATAVRYRIPVAFIVSNNAALGNVLLRQRSHSELAAEFSRLLRIDWAGFARSIGAQGVRVDSLAELTLAIKRVSDLTGPLVIDVKTSADCGFPDSHLVSTCCMPGFGDSPAEIRQKRILGA